MRPVAEKKPTSKQKWRMLRAIAALVAVVAAAVGVFAYAYQRYTDHILYDERLMQMRNVTSQLFTGLEDVVNNQWYIAQAQMARFEKDAPTTVNQLIEFMQDQADSGQFEQMKLEMIAIDSRGRYYTENGIQGLFDGMNYLEEQPEQLSFVGSSMTGSGSRMYFLNRLRQAVTIENGDSAVKVIYYGISRDMTEMNPYFKCAVYEGKSSVYVLDDFGMKMFTGTDNDNTVPGMNVYKVLSEMDYLHGVSFDSVLDSLRTEGTAYSNAILDGVETYYALYRMQNAAWTVLFLVPARLVAVNTVQLVNSTSKLILGFAVVMLILGSGLIYWLLKRQQKRQLFLAEQSNALLSAANEKLEKLNVELQAASQAKSNFLSNMSHDIRTPMNAIVGITKLMDHDKNDPMKMETYIHKVQISSQHLLSLINDVLDMSKIESNAVVLNEERVNLAEQVGQIESIIRPQTEERGQRFAVRVSGITHEYLIGDAVRLRQIFINLLSNAVKYTPNGGSIALEVAEEPGDRPDWARYRITVTDNGYGMTEEFVKHIFEPFTRAENSTTNKVQGTGLGMAITKSIVDMVGGTITVQSEPGKGSRFTVRLPMRLAQDGIPELPCKEILVISDEEDFLENARAAFRETAVHLRAARTEPEADALLAEEKAEVVLLGGCLEGRTLEDNLHRLRAETKDALLFYCCDYDGQLQLGGIAEKGGVDGVLTRPLFVSNLIYAIERAQNRLPADTDPEGAVLKGLRFLCAEDNTLNAEILTAIMDMQGASCVIYPDGQKLVEAFANVKEGDYDAILMDVQMPVMNGLDATRAIRHGENPLGKTIPIIAMTANAFSEDVQNCLNAGMNAHVSKPLDIETLERTLKSVLGGKFSGGGTPVHR